MANEAIGFGTTLAMGDGGSPESFTPIARITEIGEFGLGEADDVDITAYDSPDRYREFIAGLVDAGEIEITGIWTADQTQQDLSGIIGTTKNWKITLPSGLGEFAFTGYIKSGPRWNPQLEDRIEFMATIKISGKPTFTVSP